MVKSQSAMRAIRYNLKVAHEAVVVAQAKGASQSAMRAIRYNPQPQQRRVAKSGSIQRRNPLCVQ